MNKENKQTEKRSSLLKRIFNIRQWSDWYRVKAGARYFWTSASKLSQADRQRQVEDFKHAQLRLGLSDEALARRGLYLRRLSYFMLFLSALIFCYGIYHLFYASWIAFILSLVVTSIGLSLAFRYHFWWFQISRQTLGCTFSEWYQASILGRKQ